MVDTSAETLATLTTDPLGAPEPPVQQEPPKRRRGGSSGPRLAPEVVLANSARSRKAYSERLRRQAALGAVCERFGYLSVAALEQALPAIPATINEPAAQDNPGAIGPGAKPRRLRKHQIERLKAEAAAEARLRAQISECNL